MMMLDPYGRYTSESTAKISQTLFCVLNAEMSRPRFNRLLVKDWSSESTLRRSKTANWMLETSVSGGAAGSGILSLRRRLKSWRQMSETICFHLILSCLKFSERVRLCGDIFMWSQRSRRQNPSSHFDKQLLPSITMCSQIHNAMEEPKAQSSALCSASRSCNWSSPELSFPRTLDLSELVKTGSGCVLFCQQLTSSELISSVRLQGIAVIAVLSQK